MIWQEEFVMSNYTRYTLEKARQLFADNGCKLLAENYKNTSISMPYLCQCGAESTIALADFKRGRRCSKCGNSKAASTRQSQVIDFEKIKEHFAEQNCKLVSNYEDYYGKLEYICSCGRVGKTAWYSFKLGRRCGRCSSDRKKIYLIEEIIEIFKNGGCEFLDDHYEGCDIPVKYRCQCGKESKISLRNFRKGNRCKECGLKKNTGSGNHNWIKDRKKKRENDLFRLKCCTILHRSLKSANLLKNDRTHKLLGYTHFELKEHIKNHSNWENVKDGKWHVDHIFPIVAFFDYGISDLKIINCLDNLRPLSQKENNVKSGKYDKEKFEKWLEAKGIIIDCIKAK